MSSRSILVLFLALALAACSTEGSRSEALIDDQGGRVDAPNGAAIDVPAGAVDAPTSFTVHVEVGADHLDADVEAVGPMITFGPEGARFATPVRVTLPATREPMVLLTRPHGATEWARVDGAVWDAETGMVTAEVMHFSDFVPVAGARGDGGGGGPVDAGPGGGTDAGDPCVINPRDPMCVPPPVVLPSCDAITQDCAAGQKCVATDQESGYDWGDGRPAWCIPAGPTPLGGSCTAPNDCAAGTQCVIQTMYDSGEGVIWYSQEERELTIHPATCMQLCLHASPSCPGGEVCHPIQLWGFSGRSVNEVVGVCAPPPPPIGPRP